MVLQYDYAQSICNPITHVAEVITAVAVLEFLSCIQGVALLFSGLKELAD